MNIPQKLFSRIKVLVVDDNRRFSEGLASVFFHPNFDVQSATGRAEARKILSRETVDLLIANMRLPLGSGDDLVDSILGSEKAPLIILLTENIGRVINYSLNQSRVRFFC